MKKYSVCFVYIIFDRKQLHRTWLKERSSKATVNEHRQEQKYTCYHSHSGSWQCSIFFTGKPNPDWCVCLKVTNFVREMATRYSAPPEAERHLCGGSCSYLLAYQENMQWVQESMALLALFYILFSCVSFISCGRIATDVCEVTSLSDLVDIRTKAHVERVAVCNANKKIIIIDNNTK